MSLAWRTRGESFMMRLAWRAALSRLRGIRNAMAASLALLTCAHADAALRVVIVGDSTASSYPEARHPRTGWGQVLAHFVDKDVQVLNRAVSGRSTLDYRSLGHFDATMARLRADDLLLIQFGHNDQKRDDPTRYTSAATSFPEGLLQFVRAARRKGAVPVLLTPVARRAFDAQGRAVDTHGEYAQAVRKLAAAEQVALIDLSRRSMDWIEALGPDASKAYYLHDPVQGLADDTHFHRRGAIAIACLVVGDLVSLGLLPAERVTRDVDCGVPADSPRRLARQKWPSLIENADASAQVQIAPHGGDGITLASAMFSDAPGFDLVMRRRVLHQGASIGLHAHGKDEVYYVLSGRGELSLDGKLHVLVPGAAVLTRDASSHSLRQVGSEDLAILVIYRQASMLDAAPAP